MIEANDTLRLDGVITYWSPARFTVLADLITELSAIGLNRLAPQPRTSINALQTALEEVFPTRSHRVEHLKDRRAFEVIQIVRGEEANTYMQQFRFWIDENQRVDCRPYNYQILTQVVDTYNTHCTLVTAKAVTDVLLGALANLGGTRLRDQGAAYWLPAVSLEQWREVAHAVEAARTRGSKKSNCVYVVRHVMDDDALRAVRDGIIGEVEQTVATINKEIMEDNLGKRALEARKSQADQLRKKIALYETILKERLPTLSEAVDRAERAAVSATLLLATAAE